MKLKITNSIVCCLLLAMAGFNLAHAVNAVNYTQFGRYLTVTNAPKLQGDYGLNAVVERHFPPSTTTLGSALRRMLKQTGYALLPLNQTSPTVRDLYKKPLPSFYRALGPMPLYQALLCLSGSAYQLVVDPVHRLVTFKLRQNYQAL